jgi:hypothetical protein
MFGRYFFKNRTQITVKIKEIFDAYIKFSPLSAKAKHYFYFETPCSNIKSNHLVAK